ncbi:MAG: U32 family peptidase, partial [Marinilabiliaceae bacterium]|nr:U32 family peptidase [Marinilabiliaceae bacterium]
MEKLNLTRSDVEIMAPVGSYESLMAAIQGGADSVYFGIEQLNMRSRSSHNFTREDLKEIVRIANENEIKTYLTVNTVIFNEELPLLREIIDVAKEANVTAVIASDQAAINYAHNKGVEVHISTQVNISNIETLKFYSKFADVVVLARELNMEQVSAIHQAVIDEDVRGPRGELIKIEMFSHGALCMATSGKCYISLHQLNTSANRGGCLQPCRRGYTVKEKESGIEMDLENEYIMSPKDLKTIHFLNKMMDAGVRVFKIEGRARSAEYVKTVCECYNEAIHAVIDGTFDEEKIDDWNTRLAEVFNRGFW